MNSPTLRSLKLHVKYFNNGVEKYQCQCQSQSEFLSWLVIAVVISESTKAYKSIKQKRICGKEMSSDADGRLIKTGTVVHLDGESSM